MRHVPHLLVPTPSGPGAIDLDDAQVHHLSRVLRLEPGSPVTYTDGTGLLGEGRLGVGVIERGPERRLPPEPRLDIICAPPRAKDRARFLVEKVAEAGATSLRWIRTAYTQGAPPKHDRAQAWADAALCQSRGAWRTAIDVATWDDIDGRLLVADPTGRPFGPGDLPAAIVIGPEGGFEPGEVPNRGEAVTLGGRILRTETAAVAAVVLGRHPGRSGEERSG